MLIRCPECDLQVSDKAISCPHCGFPLKQNIIKRQTTRRKKLPNGFGQITKVKQNLRKPYRAMVTVGKDSYGKPICRLLQPEAYFSSYNEAYEALLEYNKNPYDEDTDISMEELFNKWFDSKFPDQSLKSSMNTYKLAWKYCEPLYKLKVRQVRIKQLRICVESAFIVRKNSRVEATDNIKFRIKTLLNQMFDYAVSYELADKNYARMIKGSYSTISDSKNPHINYSEDEMSLLWANINKVPFVDLVIIQCYSGWRPRELLELKVHDVNINEWTFLGGMKTKAGTNRTVPIHSKIQKIVANKYKHAIMINSQYLFCHEDSSQITYQEYARAMPQIISALQLNEGHRPHDARVQFVTLCKRYNVDEYAIKYIVGHVINDITEKIYTKRDPEWLRKELEKIR